MRVTRRLLCASILLVAAASAQPAAPTDLEGLWVAQAHYDSAVRG